MLVIRSSGRRPVSMVLPSPSSLAAITLVFGVVELVGVVSVIADVGGAASFNGIEIRVSVFYIGCVCLDQSSKSI